MWVGMQMPAQIVFADLPGGRRVREERIQKRENDVGKAKMGLGSQVPDKVPLL